MSTSDKIEEGFRSAIQDLLVPELKAIQTELQHHNERFEKIDRSLGKLEERLEKNQVESNRRFESMQSQMDQRFKAMQKHMDQHFDAMQKQMDQRFDAMQRQMDKRFETIMERLIDAEKTQERILAKLDSLADAVEMKKNLANFEGRFTQLEKIVLAEKTGAHEVTVS